MSISIMIAFIIYLLFYIEIIMAAFPLWLNNNYSLRCKPKKIYRSEYGYCTCTEDGDWPNAYCSSYFQRQQDKQECDPNGYVVIDCNICRCSSDGKIDKSQCTKHECKNKSKMTRRSNSHNTCQPGMWYTVSPCRVCYCVDKNKLFCNNNFDSPKVRVGKYDLNMCGDHLLDDLLELVSSDSKNTNYNKIEVQKFAKKSIMKDNINKKSKLKKDKRVKKHPTEINYNNDNLNMVDSRTKFDKNEYNVNEDRAINNNVNIKDESLDQNNADILIGTDVMWGDDAEENGTSKIKLKIPDLLGKFLNLVMRKSMVTIDSGTDCTPGTTTKIDCNTCFCLMNRNVICTKNICN